MEFLMKIFNLIILVTFFFSCLKTAEQIKREEQTVVREQQSQKMLADLMVKTKNLEDQVSMMQGNFQEINQQNETSQASKKDIVEELRIQIDEQDRKIKKLEKELKGQKKFIKSVNKTLKKLSKALLK